MQAGLSIEVCGFGLFMLRSLQESLSVSTLVDWYRTLFVMLQLFWNFMVMAVKWRRRASL